VLLIRQTTEKTSVQVRHINMSIRFCSELNGRSNYHIGGCHHPAELRHEGNRVRVCLSTTPWGRMCEWRER